MPALSFTLPHWLYWVGLLVFPLIAMALARRPKSKTRKYSIGLGYMILVTGGIVGLHRFYLKNLLGLVYIPLLIFILYANGAERDARAVVSDYANQLRMAERTIEREEPRIEDARAAIPDLETELETAREEDPESFAVRSVERRLERARDAIATGEERLAEARATREELQSPFGEAQSDRAFWSTAAGTTFWIILALMAIDAVLIPRLVRKANESIETETHSQFEDAHAPEPEKKDADYAENWIDRLSLFCGEYVSYWAVIAVFVYYYEVIARYVFNSPTNWAHEAMYLMFGMQYLIAGAYAMLTESHVRVDVFYAEMSARRKAITDLATSVFFFIFAGTLLWTSYTFAMDALAVPTGNSVVSDWARGQTGFLEMLGSMNLAQWTDPNIRWGEISFNEWEVPLWPMKWVMVIGGLLLILQGISKVLKDIQTIVRGGPQDGPHGAAAHMREAE